MTHYNLLGRITRYCDSPEENCQAERYLHQNPHSGQPGRALRMRCSVATWKLRNDITAPKSVRVRMSETDRRNDDTCREQTIRDDSSGAEDDGVSTNCIDNHSSEGENECS